ncbi:MAG: hypothetical protein NTX61_02535 [Bacteroidetes bacterium]|nr:hypothetical protein [Bacteroidota bacterium]
MDNFVKKEKQNDPKSEPDKDQGNIYNSPPRAPLVLRIGVTGHRPEPDILPPNVKRKRDKPDIPAIRATIKEVLEIIQFSFKGVPDANGHLFVLQNNQEYLKN